MTDTSHDAAPAARAQVDAAGISRQGTGDTLRHGGAWSDRDGIAWRPPQPTLTDAEREAIEVAARFLDKWGGVPNTIASATLRGLLERLGGER